MVLLFKSFRWRCADCTDCCAHEHGWRVFAVSIIQWRAVDGSVTRELGRRQSVAERLEADHEIMELAGGIATVLLSLLNIPAHSGLYIVQQAINFLGGAFNHKLYVSVG